MMTEQGFADFLQNHETLQRFSARYRDDAVLRTRIAGGTGSGNAPLSTIGSVGSLGSIPSTAGSAGSISSVQV